MAAVAERSEDLNSKGHGFEPRHKEAFKKLFISRSNLNGRWRLRRELPADAVQPICLRHRRRVSLRGTEHLRVSLVQRRRPQHGLRIAGENGLTTGQHLSFTEKVLIEILMLS